MSANSIPPDEKVHAQPHAQVCTPCAHLVMRSKHSPSHVPPACSSCGPMRAIQRSRRLPGGPSRSCARPAEGSGQKMHAAALFTRQTCLEAHITATCHCRRGSRKSGSHHSDLPLPAAVLKDDALISAQEACDGAFEQSEKC